MKGLRAPHPDDAVLAPCKQTLRQRVDASPQHAAAKNAAHPCTQSSSTAETPLPTLSLGVGTAVAATQTNRETEGQRDRGRDRETERQRDRETETETETHTTRHTQTQTLTSARTSRHTRQFRDSHKVNSSYPHKLSDFHFYPFTGVCTPPHSQRHHTAAHNSAQLCTTERKQTEIRNNQTNLLLELGKFHLLG